MSESFVNTCRYTLPYAERLRVGQVDDSTIMPNCVSSLWMAQEWRCLQRCAQTVRVALGGGTHQVSPTDVLGPLAVTVSACSCISLPLGLLLHLLHLGGPFRHGCESLSCASTNAVTQNTGCLPCTREREFTLSTTTSTEDAQACGCERSSCLRLPVSAETRCTVSLLDQVTQLRKTRWRRLTALQFSVLHCAGSFGFKKK